MTIFEFFGNLKKKKKKNIVKLKVLELKIRYFKNQKIANNSRCDYEVYGLSTNLNSPSPTKYDSLKVNSRKGFFCSAPLSKN